MTNKPIDMVDLFHLAAQRAAHIFSTPDLPVEITVVYRSGRREQLLDPFFTLRPAPKEPPPRPPNPDEPPDLLPGVKIGDNFRCLNWRGHMYSFTEPQSAAVKLMLEALARGVPDVSDKTLLKASGSDSVRLSDVFKDSPAWGQLVVEGGTRGVHRLAEPAKEESDQ